MQAAHPAKRREDFESITIFADGEPLLLEISRWTADSAGLSIATYLKRVPPAAAVCYQVSADQIRMIAEASDLRLQPGGGSQKEFIPRGESAQSGDNLAEYLVLTIQ